jgi:hypothetical protein
VRERGLPGMVKLGRLSVWVDDGVPKIKWPSDVYGGRENSKFSVDRE